jgi:O-antigen/teichoic acid export membrane protein
MTQNTITVSEYHGLMKNSLWVIVSNLSMAFILALTVLASRRLGDAVFGQYVFLLAIATLLSNLCVLGTTDYVGILCARETDRTGELVANTLGMRLPFATLFIILCLIATYLTMPQALLASFLIALDWVVRTVIHLYRGVLRARNAFHKDALVSTIERLSVLICASIGLLLGQSLIVFLLGFILGRLIGMLACFQAYRQLGERLWVAFSLDLWRRILWRGFPIGIRTSLNSVSFRIDAVMLGILRATEEVGWYGAAYKFLEISFFLREAIVDAFQPSISRAYGQHNLALIRDLYGRAYKWLLITGGLMTAIAFAYADPIVALVFGQEYANSADALKILAWAMLLTFGSMTSLTLLDAVDSGSRNLFPSGMAVVVNVMLNAILISHMGYLGAAWSTLMTEAFLLIVLLWTSFRLGYTFSPVWLYGPLLACAVYTFVATILPLPIVVGATLGCCIFFLALFAFRAFDATDYSYGYLLAQATLGKFSPLKKSFVK